MELHLEPAGDGRLRLQGELTIYSAAAAREALLARMQPGAPLELDLAGVTEIDSAGLQLLMSAKLHARAQDGELRLAAHAAPVLELIELLDVGAWLGDPLLLPQREDAP